jgi:hypothetical protein
VLAAEMGPRQACLAKRVGERLVRGHVECSVLPVQSALHGQRCRSRVRGHSYYELRGEP